MSYSNFEGYLTPSKVEVGESRGGKGIRGS